MILDPFISLSLFRQPSGTSVSAVNILKVANINNMPIYTITQDNVSAILPLLTISQSLVSIIQQAVNSNKIVIIPQQAVSISNWSGIGYIVQDLETGAGAYLIEGGLNGGESPTCQPDTEPLKKIIFSMAAFIALVVAARYLLYLILQFGRLLAATAGTPIAALAANSLRSVLAAIPALVTAEAQAKGAPAGNYDECSCQDNYVRCLGTRLADNEETPGESRCQACKIYCETVNNGVWPISMPSGTLSGGYKSCDYGLFE